MNVASLMKPPNRKLSDEDAVHSLAGLPTASTARF